MLKHKKIALVYDWFDKWGGAERVLLTLNDMFPHADWFTSFRNRSATPWADDLHPKTSFLQKMPSFIRSSRILSSPLLPFAFESFDFSGYDIVISISSSYAKAVITHPETLHISYVFTPTRYLWGESAEDYMSTSLSHLIHPYLSYLKQWDFIAAQRADLVVTLSNHSAQKIKEFYERDALVLPPPFDYSYWENTAKDLHKIKLPFNEYYLVVSRLEPYKKIDIALTACLDQQKNLVVVGAGSQKNKLKQMAGDNVFFIDNIKDAELGSVYSHAEAVIMPQIEDFGLVALEAQFFGCPVLAYEKGGSLESLLPGKTALFFDTQSSESLSHAIEKFETNSYNVKQTAREYGPAQARKYDLPYFKERLLTFMKL